MKTRLRSQRAVTTEANRVHRALQRLLPMKEEKREPGHAHTVSMLLGAQQALTWALRDFAQSPTKAFVRKPRRKRS